MPEPRAVAFVTLGCKVNRAESEAAAARLLGSGWRLAEAAEADVVVVNTCTVTSEADHKARKAVHRALRECPGAVVVTGCMTVTDGEALAALGERVTVEPDKTRLPSLIAELAGVRRPGEGAEACVRSGAGFRTRAAVKVQDGCDTRCAYCIVPDARGPARSVPTDDVLAEVRALVIAGTREIVLTGINLGRFDDAGLDLAALVRTVAAAGPARVRLSSIEPLDLTPRLLDALSETPQVCAHVHVPLQSGSDAVLASMRRGYTAAQYESAIARAREALPGLAVTSDVIAGFPGETDTDFEATLALVDRVRFAKLHVFRYSARPGTPAAEMPAQVPRAVRDARAAALRAAGERLREEYALARVGQVAEVLVERVEGGIAEGVTRDYLRVRFPAEGVASGDLITRLVDAPKA